MKLWNMFAKILIVCCASPLLLGVVYAETTLHPQKTSVNQPVRAVHIVAFNLELKDVKKIIDLAEKNHFNTIVLGVGWREGTLLDSMPWVKPKKSSWTRSMLKLTAEYVRSKSMSLVVQVQLLSHQDSLLGNHYPLLMFNAKTYDPQKLEIYEIIFPIIDELIELLKPDAFHIGHDEVLGGKPNHYRRGLLSPDESMLPAESFLNDILRINNYLRKKNVEVWMWGDMLISKKEFPKMFGPHLSGAAKGYGMQLRQKVPKDIVICDWHYSDAQLDYPSLDTFQKEGFRVIGTTWKNETSIRNFSKYASVHGASGMMSTIWFHASIGDWGIVEKILSDSGTQFLKDFPDEK